MPREGLKIWGGRGASIDIIYYTTGFANIIYKNLVFGGRPGAGALCVEMDFTRTFPRNKDVAFIPYGSDGPELTKDFLARKFLFTQLKYAVTVWIYKALND